MVIDSSKSIDKENYREPPLENNRGNTDTIVGFALRMMEIKRFPQALHGARTNTQDSIA